jgi:hypothetical protein
MQKTALQDNDRIIPINIDRLSTVTGGAIDTNGNVVPGPQPVPFSTVDVPGKVTQSVPGRR